MQAYTYWDNVFTFEGSVSVLEGDGWVEPMRIDCKRRDFYPFLAEGRARECSGVRITFTTDAQNIVLEPGGLEELEGDMRLDLFINGELVEEATVERGSEKVEFRKLGSGIKKVEIWLDQRFPFRLEKLWIDDGARICKTEIVQKRWIHYGSSISHSKVARTPSKIWVGIVAQMLDLHLTNLGFGGNCKCEPMIGRLIRDLPADYITLKLGINLYDGDLTRRTFAPCVIGLIQIIREKHTDTPLAVISPIYSPEREKVPGGSDMSLEDMREILADIVNTCKKYGDRNIYYVDGLKILGPEHSMYLPDGLHPDADGQFVMADNFIREVFWRFKGIF